MKSTIEVTTANFETEVIQAAQPVLVDFWAEWCGPCKMLGPILEEVAETQVGRAKVAKVDVDKNPELAARFGITSIPTLVYFSGGKVAHQSVGLVGKKAIVAKLDELTAGATA